MAHSEKTMTFAADLLPHESNIYSLGNDDFRWKIYGNIQPIASKSYPAYTCSADNEAKAVLFFGKVTINDTTIWQAPWIIRYRVYVSTTEANTQGWYDCNFTINGSTVNYYIDNNFYSGSYRPIYHHRLIYPKSGYSSYGAYFGVRIQSSRSPTSLARVLKVELLEATNCTVELLPSIKRFDEIYITTNNVAAGTIWYNTDYTGTDAGLRVSGNANTNDTGYYIITNGFRMTAGTNKISRYTLFSRIYDGTYESFTITSNSTATTKEKNPHGFLPDGKIYYNSAGGEYTGAVALSPYEQYHSIDYRYTFNITTTGIPANTPTYVKWTYANGLLYLADEWFATTLPTTEDNFIYQKIGSNYYGSADYRASLLLDNPYYIYKNGSLQVWNPTDLSAINGADDLKAIEAISGTSGLLKKTAANTWALDTNSYVTSSGITSVTIGATSPVQSSTSTAQTGSSASTTISLADAYGDTKNPYGNKTKNYILAAPSNANGAPSFRALAAADLPKATSSAIGAISVSTGLSVTTAGALSVVYGTGASKAVQGNQTLVTLNGSNKTAASLASFYAPTGGGTAGNILISAGTNAPSWNGALTLSGSSATDWTATFKGKIIGTSSYSYGDTLPTGTQTAGRIFFQTATTEYELPSGGSSGQLLVKTGSAQTAVAWSNTVSSLTVNGTVDAQQVLHAVWNDYAECRQSNEVEPGRVITETYNGNMELATQRLMPACKVISDTYGSLMGKSQTAQTPIAVAGRVLVYPYREREAYHLGDAVCSAPDGTVDIMSREEIRDYPERIIGTVSEIPSYEIWHAGSKESPKEISVNGRIWIYVR